MAIIGIKYIARLFFLHPEDDILLQLVFAPMCRLTENGYDVAELSLIHI